MKYAQYLKWNKWTNIVIKLLLNYDISFFEEIRIVPRVRGR